MSSRRSVRLSLLLVILGHPAFGQLLDDFELLRGWSGVHSHGDACSVTLARGEGRQGGGLTMAFAFQGHMGSVAAEKRFARKLPPNFQIAFDVRGSGPPNNFIIRLMDTLDNVWVVMRADFVPPTSWTRMAILKDQIRYGWGPSGGGQLKTLDRIQLMVDVVEGGSGNLQFDNLAIEPVEEMSGRIPSVTVTSAAPGHMPSAAADGSTVTGWASAGGRETDSLTIDFRSVRAVGALVIDWAGDARTPAFDVLLSDSEGGWSLAYSATHGGSGRTSVYLGSASARRLCLSVRNGGKPVAISKLVLKGPDVGFSVNDFFGAIAADAPRGLYPRYLLNQQSAWTVVGAPGDDREALMNEQGMIETGKRSFSLEPFLLDHDTLVTWNDVDIMQSLEKGYLPIPSVRWDYRGRLRLVTTACAAGTEGKSYLLVRYQVTNLGARRERGSLFVAIRPFQVNPPWQTFTIVGGAARIDSITFDRTIRVNAQSLVSLSVPDRLGAAEFDQGHVTEYLRKGVVPPERTVHDHFGYASGALRFDYELDRGASRSVVLVVPFHDTLPALPESRDAGAVQDFFDRTCRSVGDAWESKIGRVSITLPATAPPIEATIRSNLAYILINADGPGLQPGSRSYERSWIRDGALSATALLQMGITPEVRRYLDWYATFQYPDGMIPCIVEARGPEPIPEHDSHGQFIYAVRQFFDYTRDTTWLRGTWDAVVRTVRYIQRLRGMRKTEVYRTGTPEQRACYGLVPESISHEGYCPKPMHSYWDDFFILRGLKDAAFLAAVLGDHTLAREFARERDDFRQDLYASMQLVMKTHGIAFIPGCVELGEFSGLSTTVAITPCGELGHLPEPALTNTFDESYRMFVERKTNAVRWDSYLPYEARFIGAYVHLGQKDRAEEILNVLMRDRRPASWNGWGEVVWKDPLAPRSVGDMPHSWAASDFIRSVRDMLVYEREEDRSLVIGAGIPDRWAQDPAGVSVRDLPTPYGSISFTLRRSGTTYTYTLSGDVAPGGISVSPPLSGAPAVVKGDGVGSDAFGRVHVRTLPARVIFAY